MTAIDHHKSYLFSLSCGLAWEFGPCVGSDEEVGAWVDRFASYMGLVRGAATSARRLCFGKVDTGNGDAAKARFLPGLPVDVPAGLWHGRGRAGMLLLRHPRGPDIFCGLYPDPKPIAEKIRRPLVPILGEAIMAGTLPIHGALVERRGVGVILAGRSGAGKTTCCRRLPTGWQVLCDDMALAVPAAGGGFRAHPMPTWSAFESGASRWPCHANLSVPLQALFVLEQSPGDGVEPLAGAKTTLIVERACGEALQPFSLCGPDSIPSLGRHVFESAASFAVKVPAFRLRVSLDGRFWEKIDEALSLLVT